MGTTAAAGVAGASAVGIVGWDRVAHEVGLLESPDADVPASGTEVVTNRFVSTFVGGGVRWSLAVPRTGAAALIVCLHGRGDDHRFAFETVRLHDFVAAAGAPLAVVSVDGGSDTYWHGRRGGPDPLSMLMSELLPRADRAIGERLPRVVSGWSMGGYGALLAAERYRDEFHGVCAASPAIWSRSSEAAPGAFDDAADFRAHDVLAGTAALRDLPVRVDCGLGDPFLGTSRQLVARLDAASADVESRFTAGYHDAAYWRSVPPPQIASIERWRERWHR